MFTPKSTLVWALTSMSWLVLACGRLGAAEDRAPTESQVKATFLYNFTKFVEWPARAFASPTAPFVIGIVGEDPFSGTLDHLVRGETVLGHAVMVKRCRTDAELNGCQTLFVCQPEGARVESLLQQLRNRPILTVADSKGLAEKGIIINLALVDGCIKMEVNSQAAERAGLRISSKLLGLARIVTPASKPPTP